MSDEFTGEETQEAKKDRAVVTSSEDTPPAPEPEHIASDEVLSWGKSGQVTSSVGWGEKPEPNAATAFQNSPDLQATMPSHLGRPVTSVSDHSQGNWNMDQISGTQFGRG
jgi:hypothetical protein